MIMNKQFKIGLFGSHGTGKSTLAKEVSNYFKIPLIDKTMRDMWQKYGISDFEKLPRQARKVFQYKAILNQIQKEDVQKDGFVTDRTVIDNLAYTIDSSEISDLELSFYKALVKERLKTYSHLIYVPIEFTFEKEKLRASEKSQKSIALIMEKLTLEFFYTETSKSKLLKVEGSLENRFRQVKEFINLSK